MGKSFGALTVDRLAQHSVCVLTVSVAKCPYLSVFLRKFDLESAVRKCSGRFRKFEKIKTDFEKFQSQTNFSFKLTTHHAWGIDR